MDILDQLGKQIQTLLNRVKQLEIENNNKDRLISNLAREVHQLQTDLGTQRKKFKGEIQSLASKISTVKR
jgi:predicted  nucleic acid-binding Zn-ribbon protein